MSNRTVKSLAWSGGVVVVVVCATVGWKSLTGSLNPPSLQQRVLSVASELRAPGDLNTMTVAASQSQMAQHMKFEIQQDLIAGDTPSAIVQKLVREYGQEVYATPPAHGFGFFAWALPIVFLLCALSGAIIALKRRWSNKDGLYHPVSESCEADDLHTERLELLKEYL